MDNKPPITGDARTRHRGRCGSSWCGARPPGTKPIGVRFRQTGTQSGGHGMDDVVVRAMTAGDRSALLELYAEVLQDGGAAPLEGLAVEAAFERGWLTDRDVFVVSVRGETVATFFVRANFPAFAGHIAQSGYIVARRARRQGLGGRMLQESVARAEALGFTAMMFNLVFESNPSRRLYESEGFEIVGRVPKARGDEDGLIYWRALTPA